MFFKMQVHVTEMQHAIDISVCVIVSRMLSTTVNSEIFREDFIFAKLRVCEVS